MPYSDDDIVLQLASLINSKTTDGLKKLKSTELPPFHTPQPMEGTLSIGDDGHPKIYTEGEWVPVPVLPLPQPIEPLIYEGMVGDMAVDATFMGQFAGKSAHTDTVIKALGEKADAQDARIKELESIVMELAKKIGTQRFQQVIRETEEDASNRGD